MKAHLYFLTFSCFFKQTPDLYPIGKQLTFLLLKNLFEQNDLQTKLKLL